MAYGNYLASVDPEALEQLRQRATPVETQPGRLIAVSHILPRYVEKPLSDLLGELLDGGQPIHGSYWHPLRVPLFHSAEATSSLARRLRDAWDEVVRARALAADDPWRLEIEPIVAILEQAAARGEALLSALEPPVDEERASRVELPFAEPRNEVEQREALRASLKSP